MQSTIAAPMMIPPKKKITVIIFFPIHEKIAPSITTNGSQGQADYSF